MKMRQRSALVLAAWLWVGCGWAWGGQPRQLRLQWEELESRITHKKVAFVLPDGTRVEGKVIGVEPGGLRLKVSKTSNRKVEPKGEQVVARQSLSVLRVTEYRKIGRLVGATGSIAVAAGIILAQDIDIYEGPLVVIVPAVVAAESSAWVSAAITPARRSTRRLPKSRLCPLHFPQNRPSPKTVDGLFLNILRLFSIIYGLPEPISRNPPATLKVEGNSLGYLPPFPCKQL